MKKITLGVFVFSVVALLGVGMVAAFPMGFDKGNIPQDLTEDEQAEIQAFHDSLIESIENGDYESWKNLMESQITEENFDKVVKQHKSMEERKAEMEEQRAQFCEENDCPEFEEGKFPQEFEGQRKQKEFRGEMMGQCPFAEPSE